MSAANGSPAAVQHRTSYRRPAPYAIKDKGENPCLCPEGIIARLALVRGVFLHFLYPYSKRYTLLQAPKGALPFKKVHCATVTNS